MTRTTQHSYQHQTLAATQNPIEPPDFCNVPKEARPFWDSIIKTKHPDLWSPSDLLVAANLSRLSLELEELSKQHPKRIEGGKVSPVHKVLSDLTAQQASLCRALQIHSRAIHGEANKQQPKNQLWGQALGVFDDENDFIAKPHPLIPMPNRGPKQ